jgi:hypothetical protein
MCLAKIKAANDEARNLAWDDDIVFPPGDVLSDEPLGQHLKIDYWEVVTSAAILLDVFNCSN